MGAPDLPDHRLCAGARVQEELLDHFAAGGAVEPLLVGKVALDQVPLVEELLRRQVLRPPPLRPRWLDAPGVEARLERLRRGVGPLDLVEGSTTA